MALTELQRDRIKYHLGLSATEPSITTFLQDRGLIFENVTPSIESYLIGDITTNPVEETHFYIAGVPIAAEYSILWEVETAHRRMGSEQIDPSLFVSVAGSVKLRSNELVKRRQLYDHWRNQLALVMNHRVVDNNCGGRVGYA